MEPLLNRIHHADCMGPDGLARVPSKSVDMILCDLPYGLTNCAWDVPLSLPELWLQYERIIKPNGAMVLFASQPFTSVLVCSNLRNYRDRWVWVKNKATGHLTAKKMPLNSCEDILVFYKKPPVYNPQQSKGHRPVNMARNRTQSEIYRGHAETQTAPGRTTREPNDVLYFDVVNNDDPERTNATQKPVPLLRYLIRTYTHAGAVVLDNCAGSGSTAVACIEEQRDFICFEKELKQYSKAASRIRRAKAQLPLFDSSGAAPASTIKINQLSFLP